ncbi:testis-expressed protein 26-like [Heptranchias perlo]|uniref:testis-expressed protein 26-like n=1 Tax=Heptranchias perlo TaxID=212740 RepID=UPI003559A42F
MELCLVPSVKKVPDKVTAQLNDGIQKPQCSKQPRDCREVTNDQTEGGKHKQPGISPKVTEVLTKVKEGKKESNTNLRPSITTLCPGKSSVFNPYQTTFMRDFTYRPGLVAEHTRPGSSNGYTYPYQLHEPIGASTYANDYAWKLYSKQQPIQSGSSLGCRKNIPHPCQDLLLWKLLKNNTEASHRVETSFPKPMTCEDISRVKAYQYDTIYRQDYMGIQQGFQMKCPPCLPNIRRMVEQCPPLTDSQYHYGKPNQKPELAVCTTRYGSNKHWDSAAKGIVPRMLGAHIKNQENRKQLTTYEREYGGIGVDFAKILKSLEPTAIKRYLESLPDKAEPDPVLAQHQHVCNSSRDCWLKTGNGNPEKNVLPTLEYAEANNNDPNAILFDIN